jgi:ferredoxin-thioredoxin reductase catalytic subunit
LLAQGVLNNEKKHHLKFCPCRMTSGKQQEDFKLICPCNFFIQKTWKEKGECWCGLYVKKI